MSGEWYKPLTTPTTHQSLLKLGVYISPQDRKHGATVGGRCKTQQEQEHYNQLYRQQFTELLTRYGEMFEVWFDGSIVVPVGDILAEYAPKAMVFQGPHATIRWVGNEEGIAPYPAWNSLPVERAKSGVATAADSYPDGEAWLPMECDARIRRDWFWTSTNAHTLKSIEQLMDMYYRSVGHGAVLLLNHTPDISGLIPEEDVERGAEFGSEIRRRFANSLAETKGKGEILEIALSKPNKAVVLDCGFPPKIDHVITMEDILQGERVRQYVIKGLTVEGIVQRNGHRTQENRPLRAGESVRKPHQRPKRAYGSQGSPTPKAYGRERIGI